MITGAGPIGLVVLLVARASGATKICVMDVMQNRLDVAKKMGADTVVLATAPDVVDQIRAFGSISQVCFLFRFFLFSVIFPFSFSFRLFRFRTVFSFVFSFLFSINELSL